MDRYQVVTVRDRYYIIETSAQQRVDHRYGGYSDLGDAKEDCRIMNAYKDKPHSEWCTCGQCAYERYTLTGEAD